MTSTGRERSTERLIANVFSRALAAYPTDGDLDACIKPSAAGAGVDGVGAETACGSGGEGGEREVG